MTIEELQAQIAGQNKKIDQLTSSMTDMTGQRDALKAKNDELLTEKKTAQQKAREAEAAAKKKADDAARSNGDIEALEKSWSDKFEKLKTDMQATIDDKSSKLNGMLVDSVAQQVASDIAQKGSSSVLEPHILKRLEAGERDGKPVTTVLDADGKPSALSLDELKQEFVNNPVFAGVIEGSKATGGGAFGSHNNGGGANLKRSEMDAKAKREYQQKHGQEAYLKLPK